MVTFEAHQVMIMMGLWKNPSLPVFCSSQAQAQQRVPELSLTEGERERESSEFILVPQQFHMFPII